MPAKPMNSTNEALPQQSSRKWDLKRLGLASLLIYGLWAVIVICSGAGFNPFHLDLKFERIGQLGDAFGVIGAAMATAAAVFTWDTLNLEREETARLRLGSVDKG